jgi:hypothetical protein
MKKLIGCLGIVAALGVGAFAISTVMPASAQSSPDTQSSSSSSPDGNHPRWHRHLRLRVAGGMLKVAADKIGVQPEDLVDARRNGQSIADVANAHGVNPSDVVTAIVDAGNQKLDEAVANSHLSQERADALKEKLPQVADRFVNTKGLPGCGDMNQGSDQSSSSSS